MLPARKTDKPTEMKYGDGSLFHETFSLATADRIRVSLGFVKEALAKGGELIDVRP